LNEVCYTMYYFMSQVGISVVLLISFLERGGGESSLVVKFFLHNIKNDYKNKFQWNYNDNVCIIIIINFLKY
jgi:hypothetical protein